MHQTMGENSAQTATEAAPEGQENVFCQAEMKKFLDVEFANMGNFWIPIFKIRVRLPPF